VLVSTPVSRRLRARKDFPGSHGRRNTFRLGGCEPPCENRGLRVQNEANFRPAHPAGGRCRAKQSQFPAGREYRQTTARKGITAIPAGKHPWKNKPNSPPAYARLPALPYSIAPRSLPRPIRTFQGPPAGTSSAPFGPPRGPCRAKQTQFPPTVSSRKYLMYKDLYQFLRKRGPGKTNPICLGGPMSRALPAAAGGRRPGPPVPPRPPERAGPSLGRSTRGRRPGGGHR
jgi:hypothetical protein